MKTLKVENIVSKIHDKNIKKNLQDSSIWKDCKHFNELSEEEKSSKKFFCYKVKFDGLTPIQVMNVNPI